MDACCGTESAHSVFVKARSQFDTEGQQTGGLHRSADEFFFFVFDKTWMGTQG